VNTGSLGEVVNVVGVAVEIRVGVAVRTEFAFTTAA
jgi:hypothetical protein